jgi:hypothetical protein
MIKELTIPRERDKWNMILHNGDYAQLKCMDETCNYQLI